LRLTFVFDEAEPLPLADPLTELLPDLFCCCAAPATLNDKIRANIK